MDSISAAAAGQVEVDLDRNRILFGEFANRLGQPEIGEDLRMDAADLVPEGRECQPGLLVGLADEFTGASVCVGHMPLGQAQIHRQEHQVLLRAVVQVSLDPTAFGLERVDQPAA